MRRRAAGRRDGALAIAGLLILHASCELQSDGTADTAPYDASAAGVSGTAGIAGTGGQPDASADAENPDGALDPDAGTGGADAGADAWNDAGIVACGDTPEPPGQTLCPIQCTGGCAGNTCRIACVTPLACNNQDLRCPEGYNCEILCIGLGACEEARIYCDSKHRCGAICDGYNACKAATMQCGSGSCGLLCLQSGCAEASLNCGRADCTSLCLASWYPVVNCFDSCGCTPC